MDDFVQLIIYIAIGIVGLLVSVYRNKQKRQSQSRRIPRDITAGPMPDVMPDLGPLAELFGIPELADPKPKPVPVPEPREQNVEEDGTRLEEEGFLVEKAGFESEEQSDKTEKEGFEAEKINDEGMPVFELTQKSMISDSITDAAFGEMSDIYRPISDSEIKGVEDIEKITDNEAIDWKKAVIYSEILKRRGN
jgi:hypothetical protein